jgi:hypothetical protein
MDKSSNSLFSIRAYFRAFCLGIILVWTLKFLLSNEEFCIATIDFLEALSSDAKHYMKEMKSMMLPSSTWTTTAPAPRRR